MEEDELIPMVGSIEAKDSYSAPPPGHSLTEDNSKWAWGKPPREVEPELVLEQALDSLEKPAIKEELLKEHLLKCLLKGILFKDLMKVDLILM